MFSFEGWLKKKLFKDGGKDRLIAPGMVLIIVLPVLLIAAFSYVKTKKDLTGFTLSRRQTIAYQAAVTLKVKLDHLTEIGTSFATRVRFRQLVGEGKWEEAVQILERVPKDFAFIDRVFLTDPNGTLMTDRPELPGVRGKNFAFRDWYQGVRRQWEPYISEVYTRAAEPRYNVVAVAIPIKAEDQKIIGILVLQVRLGTLLEWAKGIDVGSSGFVYFVDKKGNVVAHPKFSPNEEVIDFTSVPTVQKVLRGERGVEIMFNPLEKEEGISAFEPVPQYGWGAIAQQPTVTAFKERDESLKRMVLTYSLIALFSAFLAHLMIRYIAQRKQAEENIRKLNEDLRRQSLQREAAIKELEAFSYSVSHDLRAPLRHVDGFVELLKEHAGAGLDEKSQRYLNTIVNASKKMGNLIDDLLVFSRMAKTEMRIGRVSLDPLVEEVIRDLQGETDGRDIAWKIGRLSEVTGDAPMLRQVWANLIGNAVKYTRTRARAEIEIGSRPEGEEAVFFVRDNGVGFDPQYAGKLFGVFQRLHRADEFEGTGIGLANVRRIIYRHGGRTWAEGRLDRGATFYFSLPNKGGRRGSFDAGDHRERDHGRSESGDGGADPLERDGGGTFNR